VVAAASFFLASRSAVAAPAPASTVTDIVYGISNGGGAPADNRIYRIDLATGDLSNMVPLTMAGFTISKSQALAARGSPQENIIGRH
jgi:hypothetical protein